MDEPWSRVTEPGTLEDLVSDALGAGYEIKERTVHDWVARGLLDSPKRHGKGRGSRPGVYAIEQRKLFLLLLSKREEMPRLPALALVPLGIWLGWGEEYVPVRQIRRAMRTWLGDGRRRLEVCQEAGKGVLGQLDHPMASDTARNRVVRLFAEISYSGKMTPLQRVELEEAARAVFEPKTVFGASGLIRAEGPAQAPFTVEMFMARMTGLNAAMEAVRQDKVTEDMLRRARRVYRESKEHYFAIRPALEAQTTGRMAQMFAETSAETEINDCGKDLLGAIGLLLTAPASAPVHRM